nr:unnamed protein product [Callosobruchus chinensis]
MQHSKVSDCWMPIL